MLVPGPNLQHSLVLFAQGLRGMSRLHLVQGIWGYLAGPLWFLFLVTFNWMWGFEKYTGLSHITVHNFNPYLNLTGTEHALLIFVICMAVLMLPKVLALIDIVLDPPRRRAPSAAWRGPPPARFVQPLFPPSTRPCRCSGICGLLSL